MPTTSIGTLPLTICRNWQPVENKYLNNIVEQDHRAIKRIVKPMMGVKDFRCARIILAGIEVMHMIRKGQMKGSDVERTVAAQFYSLVA